MSWDRSRRNGCQVGQQRWRWGLFTVALGVMTSMWWMPLFAGGIDPYPFQNEDERAVFHSTVTELRCPKCQNQSVAESNAPIAEDIRKKVYEQVKAGKTQSEIVGFMVERYGDFVTYRPPVRPSTLLLWIGPPVLVLLELGGLFVRHRGRAVWRGGAVDQAEVARILQTYGDDDTAPARDEPPVVR
ncbi:MAG: cytochrome c-type biogenesis protein CcmH [Gammaproteobacteria bacterium]